MPLSKFEGQIFRPDHGNFDEVRRGWNAMIDRKPALVAQCNSAADVVGAVQYAKAHKLMAVARGGGHSVSGASLPEKGVLIDLAGLRRIEVDPDARIARVGGGCLLGELDAATQAHGLAVTAGVEPSTGVGGLTLGGGIGFLARKLGLTIDNLVGAQVVLADGRIVEASESDHADLFWALRGGGGQFGIVTRFDFRLHPVGPDVMVAQAWYPIDKAHDVMRHLSALMADAPDDLGLAPALLRVPSVDPFPAEWHGRHAVAMVACHTGNQEEARAALQPLLGLGDMIFGFVDAQPYVDFQKTFAGASPKGGRYYWKSIFVEELSDELVDVLVDGVRAIPGEYTQIFMEGLGGAVARVGVEETAFANRSACWNLGISAGWVDPAQDQEVIAATRAWAERLERFSDGTVYLNYLDRDEAHRVERGFGPNFARLTRIKRLYDPDDRFGGPLGGAH